MAKKKQIPLSTMLPALDRGDKEFYNNLDDDHKKAFSPWLAMRYASSCSGKHAEHYLMFVNAFVNADFSVLRNHPELQWKLMALCGEGNTQRHDFLPPPRKKGKNKIQQALAKIFPNMREDELGIFESINSKVEIKEIFKDAGYSDKEIKEITK